MIDINSFCDIYEVSHNLVYVTKGQKPSIAKFFHKVSEREMYIDDKAIARRKNFGLKVINISRDNYYKLTEEHTDTQIAKILSHYSGSSVASWRMFLRIALFSFSYQEHSVLQYEITDKMWQFFRYSTFLIRGLERQQAHKERRLKYLHPNRDNYEAIYKERGCSR